MTLQRQLIADGVASADDGIGQVVLAFHVSTLADISAIVHLAFILIASEAAWRSVAAFRNLGRVVTDDRLIRIQDDSAVVILSNVRGVMYTAFFSSLIAM